MPVPAIAPLHGDAYFVIVGRRCKVPRIRRCVLALIRFLFRLASLLVLAVAVIMAVLDATRSIAASELVLTPLGQSWFSVSPGTLNLAQAVIQRHLAPQIWDPFMIWVLTMPGFAVMAVLSFLLYLPGHRWRRQRDAYMAG